MSQQPRSGNPKHRTPCAVIVDTRNVRGMLSDLFGGTAFKPTASGIRQAIRDYGFDPVEIHAGIATSTSNNHPSDRVLDMVARNIRYRDELSRGGVRVLEGYLAERGKVIDEKKVDVLLALQVADVVDRINNGKSRAKCVVVLSEDMDLMPAYDYAYERNVEVYALANNTIHFREGQRKWLLLHENAARQLAQTDSTEGTPVRGYAARLALGHTSRTLPTKWKARWDQRPGDVVLFNGKGLKGTFYSTTALTQGQALDLIPAEMDFPDSGGLFPEIRLQQAAASPGPMAGAHEAVVTAWTSPTKVKATFTDRAGDCSVTIPPGSVLEGGRIAILRMQRATGLANYYIGPLDRLTLPDHWPHPTTVVTAAITGEGENNHWSAVLEDGCTSVLVHRQRLKHATIGNDLLIALTAADPETGTFRAMPLACCLPSPV